MLDYPFNQIHRIKLLVIDTVAYRSCIFFKHNFSCKRVAIKCKVDLIFEDLRWIIGDAFKRKVLCKTPLELSLLEVCLWSLYSYELTNGHIAHSVWIRKVTCDTSFNIVVMLVCLNLLQMANCTIIVLICNIFLFDTHRWWSHLPQTLHLARGRSWSFLFSLHSYQLASQYVTQTSCWVLEASCDKILMWT